ncbi:hypothetical protein [Candidatus Bodocaedibacter vickermanii]|uniref:HEAT repeat domain-containing protein n=1 Tax=Candidatus Bodocaedibacter vickermanii TaxID=2741701 RepID=A0A7L9RUP4_9PROT|nr:hypothetical protein CPBP_01012 [Candidatus Paracaedibacteraceae bacterium 'Lake Konstanz']
MFKKSVLIAALAISSALGSEIVWDEQEKLAWVWLQIKASDPEGSVLNEYQRAQAAERMSGVVRVLISDPKSIEASPIQVITSGRVLMNLGCPNEAVIVLRFLLQLNSPTISAEKIMAASMLYELGQAELATPVIRLFINDKASTPEIRQAAIRAFYSPLYG